MKRYIVLSFIAIVAFTSCTKETTAPELNAGKDPQKAQQYIDSMKAKFIAFMDENTTKQPWADPENFSWKLEKILMDDVSIKFSSSQTSVNGMSYDHKQEWFMYPALSQYSADEKWMRTMYIAKNKYNVSIYVTLVVTKGSKTFIWDKCPIVIEDLNNRGGWVGGDKPQKLQILL